MISSSLLSNSGVQQAPISQNNESDIEVKEEFVEEYLLLKDKEIELL